MRALILAATLMLAAFSSPAAAQTQCAPMPAVERMLMEYGEVPLFTGTTSGGAPFTLYLNPETLTWTSVVIIELPGQPTIGCLIVTGDDGQPARPAIVEPTQPMRLEL